MKPSLYQILFAKGHSKNKWFSFLSPKLESTDAAPEGPHPRPPRWPARRTASGFFFFFPRIRADVARFVPNRADSAKIGPYRPYRAYRPAADTANTAETGRKRPKSALSMAGKSETCILLSFFVNQGLVCVFKKYFNSKNI